MIVLSRTQNFLTRVVGDFDFASRRAKKFYGRRSGPVEILIDAVLICQPIKVIVGCLNDIGFGRYPGLQISGLGRTGPNPSPPYTGYCPCQLPTGVRQTCEICLRSCKCCATTPRGPYVFRPQGCHKAHRRPNHPFVEVMSATNSSVPDPCKGML